MEKIFNSNMHCAGCKGNIEAALKKLDGVLEVNANLVNNVVKVRYNEKKVSAEDIINACKSVGYKLEAIDEDEEYSKEKSYKFATLFGKCLFKGRHCRISFLFYGT